MKDAKTMPNSEKSAKVQTPEMVTPEVLLMASSYTEIIGLPFYISDYVHDAGERLKAIVPLSVRHRKAMEVTLSDVDPAFDPKNEADTYTVLIEALQENPGLFLRLDMDISTTVARGKRNKLPRFRIMRYLDRLLDEQGDPFEAFQKALSGRPREDALFTLFLGHVIESSKARLDTFSCGRDHPDETDSTVTSESEVEATCIDDLPAAITETEEAPRPIPKALAIEWQQTCIEIEVLASDMAEYTDARGLEALVARTEKLQALADLAKTIPQDRQPPVTSGPASDPEVPSAAALGAASAIEQLIGPAHAAACRETVLTADDETSSAMASQARALAETLRYLQETHALAKGLDAQMKAMSAIGDWDNVQEHMAAFRTHKANLETTHASANDLAAPLARDLGIEIEVFETGEIGVRTEPASSETELVDHPPAETTSAALCERGQEEDQSAASDARAVTMDDSIALNERPADPKYAIAPPEVAPEEPEPSEGPAPEVTTAMDETAADTPVADESTFAPVEVSRPAAEPISAPAQAGASKGHADATPGEPKITIDGDPLRTIADLLRNDHTAVSARFGIALDALQIAPPVGSDVLRVAAASRLAFDSYDSNVHEFVQMVGQAAGEIPNLGPDEAEARALILFGALLRPAILVRDIQLRKILGDLNLRRFGPVLTDLQSEIGRIEYTFAPKIDEIAEAAGRPKLSRLDILKRDLGVWHEHAKGRSGPCQPSTFVVHKIVTNGEVGTMVDKVLRGTYKADELDYIVDRYGADEIEARIREINRGAGTQSKGNFPQISWRFMKRHIGEGIDLLTSFRDLSARRKGREQTDLEMIQRRVSTLQKKQKVAAESLRGHDDFGKVGLVGAATQWLDVRLSEFECLLDGDDIESYNTISAALGDDLDLLPTGCQPVQPESLRLGTVLETEAQIKELEAEDRAVIDAVFEERILLPLPSIEEKIAGGAFMAARRLAERYIEIDTDREAMLSRIQDTRQARINELIRHISDTSRRLKDLSKIDLAFQEEIVRATDRLDETAKLLAQWSEGDIPRVIEHRGIVDIYQVPHAIAKAKDLITQVEQSVRADQFERLCGISELNVSAETRADIARLREQIETLPAELIEDRLAAIRDGRPIGEMELENTRSFEAFFPDFVEAASNADWPSNPDAYQDAFTGGQHPHLKIGTDRQAAGTELMTAWFKLARQLPSGTPRPQSVEALLELLTFTSPKAQQPRRISGLKQGFVQDLRMDRPTSDVFCPPVLGSSAGGHYRALIVGPGVLFEQIEDQLEKMVPTFVLVAERMSVEKRREFAAGFRRSNVQALMIDEALIAYIAISTTRRLETLLDCTLPFGRFESYTDSAGKLPREMFFGREEDIEIITSREAHGCLVYGGRQLGKSALLAQVQEIHHNKERAFIVALDTVKTLGESNRPAREVWGIVARMLHGTDAGITTGRETTEEAVVRAIQIWLDAHRSGRILILLDETDNFLSAEARNGYINLMPLKTLMENTNRGFKIVFAGLHNVRRIYDDPNSPLPHLGKPICVGPLNVNHNDKKSARDLVVQPMRAAGFVFENPMAVDKVLAYVNHYPSLVQTFCKGLLQHLHRQRASLGDGPLWKIPDALVFSGEGFDQIRDQIREKFQLTLRLDPRYALIANVMALIRVDRGDESILRSGLRTSEIREETLRHWPQHIQVAGESDFRALLDELSQLGILSKISSDSFGSSRYVLRTREVAQMLGQETEIIEALSTLYEREGKIDYDPSTYHRAYKAPSGARQMLRSPLSDSQFQRLLDPKAPGCKFITGLPIMGLRNVADAVRHILVGFGNCWGEVANISAIEASCDTFSKEVRSTQATRGMKKIKLVFVRPKAGQIDQLITFAESRSEVTAGDVRPVFLLDATDENLRNIAVRRDAIVLQPWGHEMLRTYLHEEELDTLETREIREQILSTTGGIPGPLLAKVDELSRLSRRVGIDDIVPDFTNLQIDQYLPGATHKMVLSYIESVSRKSEHDMLIEMLDEEGCEKPTDIIEDLYTLGFLRLYDKKRGTIDVSAFGLLVQRALAAAAPGTAGAENGDTPSAVTLGA